MPNLVTPAKAGVQFNQNFPRLRHALEIAPCISSISAFPGGHAGMTSNQGCVSHVT